MCYETLFCLSRSFKLVPLAVTSGYILSFAYPPVEKNTDGNLQIKAPRLRVIRRTYSAITLAPTFFFLIVEWELLDEQTLIIGSAKPVEVMIRSEVIGMCWALW